MPLSRLAQEFAALIKYHDWSDSPDRLDRAGHRRELDSRIQAGSKPPLNARQTEFVRTNVMWVVATVLMHSDPNLNPWEFAEACGVDPRTPHTRRPNSGHITAGLGLRELEAALKLDRAG